MTAQEREINRLKYSLARSQEERDRWRRVAEKLKQQNKELKEFIKNVMGDWEDSNSAASWHIDAKELINQ